VNIGVVGVGCDGVVTVVVYSGVGVITVGYLCSYMLVTVS